MPGFGTGPGANPRLRVLGTASPEQVAARRLAPSREDDGSIPLASVVAEVRENLAADVRSRGGSPGAAVRVLNSRDNPAPWGRPNVTRLVLGGSIEQSTPTRSTAARTCSTRAATGG